MANTSLAFPSAIYVELPEDLIGLRDMVNESDVASLDDTVTLGRPNIFAKSLLHSCKVFVVYASMMTANQEFSSR